MCIVHIIWYTYSSPDFKSNDELPYFYKISTIRSTGSWIHLLGSFAAMEMGAKLLYFYIFILTACITSIPIFFIRIYRMGMWTALTFNFYGHT